MLSLPLLLVGSLTAELYRVGTSSSGKDRCKLQRINNVTVEEAAAGSPN